MTFIDQQTCTARSLDLPNAIVLQAGRHQFRGGARLHHPYVYSRRLVRCLEGRGVVRINRTRFEMQPGDFLFMPWGHSITYLPDEQRPMLLSGIHIVPDYDAPDEQVQFGVPHDRSAPFANDPRRRDAPIPGFESTVKGRFSETSRLFHLTEYIVEWFMSPHRTVSMARLLATTLLSELVWTREGSREDGWPAPVRAATRLVRADLIRDHSLSSLSSHAGCSASTLSRHFHDSLGVSPMAWVQQERMTHATLLLATTGLRVGEIGAAVGIPDPYYFSKLFKRTHGVTAREYRRQSAQF